MTTLFGIVIFFLFCFVIVQIARITELSSALRGEEHYKYLRSKRTANAFLVFMVVFLAGTILSVIPYKNYMLGYGPHDSASVHGEQLDNLMFVTIVITGIVFVLTHIALFYFTWKYRERKGGKAEFISHDNKLEVIWTVTPALAMIFLVINGIVAWKDIMWDVEEGEEYIEVEATGMQFSWILRYPGSDGVLGQRNFRDISGINPLGQVWSDVTNLDDFHADQLVLPKGKQVRVRITSRDVLHNFYLPHFRLKMDAVPGMPTYFVFTPRYTTEEYRQKLKEYKEYQVPADPTDPNGPQKWEAFEYELACAELCGNGHYSMRKIVKVVEPREYEQWLQQQNSYYFSTIRGSDDDPFKGQLLDVELKQHEIDLRQAIDAAKNAEDLSSKSFTFEHLEFKTGSAELTPNSIYEIKNLVAILQSEPELRLELSGHTDNTGDPANNAALSKSRAEAVLNLLVANGISKERLIAKGYGSSKPLESNDTEEGRAANRRTEIRIL